VAKGGGPDKEPVKKGFNGEKGFWGGGGRKGSRGGGGEGGCSRVGVWGGSRGGSCSML